MYLSLLNQCDIINFRFVSLKKKKQNLVISFKTRDIILSKPRWDTLYITTLINL